MTTCTGIYAWAIIVGQKVGEALGGKQDARAEYQEIMRRLDAVDPRRSKLDIMQSEDGPWNQDHCDKAVWILSKCQSKYGDDSMARVLQLRGRKYGIRKAVTLTQLLDLFAEVSGDAAIHDWYAKIGIHLPADRRRKRTNQ